MSVSIDYTGGVFKANKAKKVGSFNPLNDDGDFDRVTLLMHMDGTNGSTSFPDTFAYNHSSTASETPKYRLQQVSLVDHLPTLMVMETT